MIGDTLSVYDFINYDLPNDCLATISHFFITNKQERNLNIIVKKKRFFFMMYALGFMSISEFYR